MPDRDGTRRSFSGSPEEIAGDIRSFAAIGVHELIFDFRSESIPASIERLQRFAAEVMPLVEGTQWQTVSPQGAGAGRGRRRVAAEVPRTCARYWHGSP